MTKYPAVLIAVLSILFFTIGCANIPPEPSADTGLEPSQAKPPQPEPPQAEPAKTEPVKTEPAEAETSPAVTFHDKCADTLREFVSDKGMVNYRMLKRKRLELKALLDEFRTLDPNEYNRWPKEDKIAFWLNAYNIQTLKIITDNYPIEASRILSVIWGPYSIRHIDKQIGGINKQKFIMMDEVFTLAEIEQRFFRREFDEQRVFFALSGACLSSPPLRNEPYYGNLLYKQLDDQTEKFLAGPLAFRIDREKNIVHLSAILQPNWYGSEFITSYGTDKKFKDQPTATRAVLNFISNYIQKRDVAFLETANYSVDYITHNWTINE